MFKKAIATLIVLPLVIIAGCSSGTKSTASTTPPAGIKSVREAEIASTWSMKQVEINLQTETHIVLKLASGDKVDGYYYVEKGDSVGFVISGNSKIYESAADAKSPGTASDRFSFTASTDQGIAYTLALTPTGSGKNGTGATVFLEIIYPATGEILVPFGTK